MYVVKEIIDNWDPLDLFPFCPQDEYDCEIRKIEEFMKETKDEKELGEYIYTLFIQSFEKENFQHSLVECNMIAHSILVNMR